MKKSILLISLFLFAGLAFAGEQSALSQTGTDWQSSLSGIKEATQAVVLTNQMLEVEFASLNTEVAALEQELTDLEASYQQLRDIVRRTQSVGSVASHKSTAENELEFTRKTLEQKKQELVALQAKREAEGKRQALRRLTLKELELEKQAGLIDQSAKGDPRLEDLRLEVRALKEQLDSVRGQEKYIRERMQAAGVKEGMTVQGDQDAAQELARLESRKKELAALRRSAHSAIPEGKSEGAQAQQLDRQSDLIEEQLAILRENVALLEYRINTLGQYKNSAEER